MLELKDLHKSYGDVVALDGCSFTVPRGTLLGFLGPNGAGKTTAMRSVFGLLRPDHGSVSWDGALIDSDVRLRFGYMPEQRGLYPRMKVIDQIVYFARLHGVDAATAEAKGHEWLERLGLEGRAGSRLEELSHGNQQRVQLAVALAHEPELLVLDEPFSGLDPLGVQSMADILAERAGAGTAVVFSSHQLDLVEDLCEEVVIINRGAIVLSGPVRRLRAESPRRYLDVEVTGARPDWASDVLNAQLIEVEGDRARFLMGDDADLSEVIATVGSAGKVQHFAFEPPNLSEVFREAVGQ